MAKITNSYEFLEALKAERKRLGLKSSGTLELMGTTDSSDTTSYEVVMISRKPRPEGEAPKV